MAYLSGGTRPPAVSNSARDEGWGRTGGDGKWDIKPSPFIFREAGVTSNKKLLISQTSLKYLALIVLPRV